MGIPGPCRFFGKKVRDNPRTNDRKKLVGDSRKSMIHARLAYRTAWRDLALPIAACAAFFDQAKRPECGESGRLHPTDTHSPQG